MHKILITGRNGYIASSLYKALKDSYEVTAIGRDDINLENADDVKQWFKNKTFDVVIHTAIKGGHRLYNDDMSVLDANLKIYYNLLDNREKYNKFINIGSGAEVFATGTPYGLSKYIIKQSILEKNNFYNIRAFAVFDEYERDTRFIKANLYRYINKQPIQIYQNKKMDFFYMKDFVNLIQFYIENNNLIKEIDCSYERQYDLQSIANVINSLADYKVDIQTELAGNGSLYMGHSNLPIQVIGLETGIKTVYENILCTQ